jgi:uncharacterized protein with FMN-binding domain
MSKRMPRRLVALSSSAIAAIYFAGFSATRAADAGMLGGANAVPTALSNSGGTSSTNGSAPTVSPYKDGTYTGTGSSRRGNVTVSVTIAGGRITAVNLTRVATEYPASAIASLPAQVVATQSAQLNGTSGATYSAQAFRGAVQAALQQATE